MLTGTVWFLKTTSNKAEHSCFQEERERLYVFKRKNTKKILKVCSTILNQKKNKTPWREDTTSPLQVTPPKNAIRQTVYGKWLRH